MVMRKGFALLLIFMSAAFAAYASVDVPPALIQKYTIVDYEASGQNWDLVISPDGILYVANNLGLLVFDGNRWITYALPDTSVIYRVTLSNDTVFTKGETSVGYWLPDGMGKLLYYPLEQLPRHVAFSEHLKSVPFSLPEEINKHQPSVTCSIDSLHFIGTLGNGIYVTDKKGNPLLNISTRVGLQDNIVHSLYIEDWKHVWIAFDNGLSRLIFNSPLRLLATRSRVGKLLDVVMDNGTMYIKTNTNYYKRTLDTGVYAFPAPEEEAGPYFHKKEKKKEKIVEDLLINIREADLLRASDGIYPVSDSLYWFTKGNEAALASLGNGTYQLKCRILFDNYDMNLVHKKEQIFPLNDSLHIASTMQGVVLINSNNIIRNVRNKGLPLRFTQMEYTDHKGSHALDIHSKNIRLPHDFYRVSLSVASSVYNLDKHISYKIENVSEDWSGWQKDGKIDLLQLPPGKYTVYVRRYISIGDYPVISLNFEVLSPWYKTNWAILICLLTVGGVLHVGVRKHLSKQKRKAEYRRLSELQEEQQKMQQLEKKILETELQNKKNELMRQTSNLVEKGVRMNRLLEELERQKEILGDRYPDKLYARMCTLVEEGLNNQHDWLAFETYFNSAHQNFIERFRQQYPYITKGDLRMCCLLRMNLTTKEIASLLNISIRGVELRRYRLKKRIGLNGETNLVDFLMNF